jgi:RNA polymerase sigma factor (TIGR02999 family)
MLSSSSLRDERRTRSANRTNPALDQRREKTGQSPPFRRTIRRTVTREVDVTALLREWAAGRSGAADRLVPVVYQQLRRRAAAHLRAEGRDHLLQPTALVNEAYLRLIDQRQVTWQNRAQFFGVASKMMRRVLVDHARRRNMRKRSGRWVKESVGDRPLPGPMVDFDVLALDELLVRLATFDPRKSRVVELRYFGGLSPEETACVLEIAPRTVEREWRAARAWLYSQLARDA